MNRYPRGIAVLAVCFLVTACQDSYAPDAPARQSVAVDLSGTFEWDDGEPVVPMQDPAGDVRIVVRYYVGAFEWREVERVPNEFGEYSVRFTDQCVVGREYTPHVFPRVSCSEYPSYYVDRTCTSGPAPVCEEGNLNLSVRRDCVFEKASCQP